MNRYLVLSFLFALLVLAQRSVAEELPKPPPGISVEIDAAKKTITLPISAMRYFLMLNDKLEADVKRLEADVKRLEADVKRLREKKDICI